MMVFLRLMEKHTHTHGYALAFRLHLSVLRSLGYQFVVESRGSGAWGPLGTKNTEQIDEVTSQDRCQGQWIELNQEDEQRPRRCTTCDQRGAMIAE